MGVSEHGEPVCSLCGIEPVCTHTLSSHFNGCVAACRSLFVVLFPVLRVEASLQEWALSLRDGEC